eukprot:SAG31_NODE_905_length_11119_cov_2.887931_14_plen_161_part_00
MHNGETFASQAAGLADSAWLIYVGANRGARAGGLVACVAMDIDRWTTLPFCIYFALHGTGLDLTCPCILPGRVRHPWRSHRHGIVLGVSRLANGKREGSIVENRNTTHEWSVVVLILVGVGICAKPCTHLRKRIPHGLVLVSQRQRPTISVVRLKQSCER